MVSRVQTMSYDRFKAISKVAWDRQETRLNASESCNVVRNVVGFYPSDWTLSRGIDVLLHPYQIGVRGRSLAAWGGRALHVQYKLPGRVVDVEISTEVRNALETTARAIRKNDQRFAETHRSLTGIEATEAQGSARVRDRDERGSNWKGPNVAFT